MSITVKTLIVHLDEKTFDQIKTRKGEMSWAEYIVQISNRVALQDETAKHIEITGVRKK